MFSFFLFLKWYLTQYNIRRITMFNDDLHAMYRPRKWERHTWTTVHRHTHTHDSPFCNLKYEKERQYLNEERTAQKNGYDVCTGARQMLKTNTPKTTSDNLFSGFLSMKRTRDNEQKQQQRRRRWRQKTHSLARTST